MKNLDTVAEELFNKIRGRFPAVTVGSQDATITNKPNEGRFFEFSFAKGKKVNITLDEDALTVMYSKNLFAEDNTVLKDKWFEFLKELRQFAKKRMLNFDTRDITKNNLDKRDYEYLSTEKTMSESKMYGTSRTSYQNIGTARMVVKHANPINQESPAGRTQQVHSIYIESDSGERFKYPYRHLNGARAMAMHVAEGGNPYDKFGKHITSLSEELANLRKFKTYMNRSSVMAEGLAQYMDVVNDRIETVKKTVESYQKNTNYKTAIENFEETVLEEVPADLSNTWVDELTIRQFNEELKGVFPYIYRLVSEANKIKELGPEDLLGESRADDLEDAYERGGESQLARALGMSSEEFEDEVNDVAFHKNLHADDDREEIIMQIIADRSDDDGNADYDDGQPSSYDEYQDLYGGDDWDHGQYDMESAYEAHLESIVSNAKHEKDPVTEKKEMFEQYVNAMRWAALLGESEFEFNGKTVTVNEKIALQENPLRFLGGLATKAGSAVSNALRSPTARQGLDDIAGLASRGASAAGNAVKGTASAVGNTVIKPAATAAGAGAGVVGTGYALLPSMDEVGQAIANAGDAITTGAGDLVSAMGDKMASMIPNLDQIGATAAKYALPVGLVIAAIWGGSKLLGSLFGKKKENESSHDDDNTVDLSPKGKGDEMKQKNEIPLDEFVKSLYDYTSNTFPKGETAVLTQVQKQYGDEAVDEAQAVMQDLVRGQDEEMARIQQLAGLR